jgi:sigma-B regulation protein RsbU (phosphoserine phosphatase)
LSPGAKLIFYSDGITEATDALDEEYGLCRLAEHAILPEASALSIVDDVQSFSNGAGVRDDASVVFIGVQR